MQMQKALSLITLVVALQTGVAPAAEQQVWSIQLTGKKATIRATPATETKYVKSTMEALQSEKVDTFALKILSQKELNTLGNADVVIAIHDQDAELTLLPDLEHRFVISLIKHLSEAGVHEVKLTLREETKISN